MMMNWKELRAVLEAADKGTGGGKDGADAEGTGATDAQKDAGADAGDGEGDGGGKEKSMSSSILDMATKDSEGQKDGEWTAPDDIPEHLRGADAAETLAKMTKAYLGARRELSTKGKNGVEGTVPETAEGYEIKAEGDDDKIAAEINSEESKPIVDAFRASALKAGITSEQFATFMREGLAGTEAAGFKFGMTAEEAQQISSDAEMAALTKAVGAKEAGTIVNTVDKFGAKMIEAGVIGKDDLEEFRIMVGTAESARLFHRILVGYLGEKPIPAAIGGDGRPTQMEAFAAHAAALKMPDGSEKDAALAEANRKIAAAVGQEPTGSIRTDML